jgi:hypothetical protein
MKMNIGVVLVSIVRLLIAKGIFTQAEFKELCRKVSNESQRKDG